MEKSPNALIIKVKIPKGDLHPLSLQIKEFEKTLKAEKVA